MTRFVVGLTLAAILLAGISPTMGADRYWNYTSRVGYPAQPYYPEPAPARQERPLLKKLLIGGALVGIGFAAGRLTAPKPDPYHSGYSGYQPRHYPTHHSAYNHGHGRRF
jgi:hypothetical protein